MATLILPDPHIGKGLQIGRAGFGGALNSRLIDQSKILDWALERAIDEFVSTIIITGDIFEDAKPHPTIITIFVSWLKKCTDHNIEVHIVLGNHEVLRSGNFYTSAIDVVSAVDMENVFIHKDIATIHIDGASFTLMPFRDRRSFNTDSNVEAIQLLSKRLPYEIAEIENGDMKVVVGHLAIEGSLPVGDEIGDAGNELFCPISMFGGYDYVWMGHIHKPQVMSKSPYIAHLGSMDISDFGETDHHKVIAIIEPKKSHQFRYLEIPTRPLRQISISVPANITNTTQYVSEQIANQKDLFNAIVKLNIAFENSDALNIDRSAIELELRKKEIFNIARISEEKKTTLVKNGSNDAIDNTVNTTSAIHAYAQANIETEIRDDFIVLAKGIVQEYREVS